MDVSQYLYAILIGVILFAVGVIWIVARVRGRVGTLRIEPGMAPAVNPAPRTEAVVKKDLSVVTQTVPVPTTDGSEATKAEMPTEVLSKTAERSLEQGYKGFRIQLRETQPGLWVASVADIRNRKKADASQTREHYQMPAALAEAKILIDRRLAARR